MASIDLPHMCHEEGFEVLEATRAEGLSRFRLRKPDPAGGNGPQTGS
jgi:hypothetical protein